MRRTFVALMALMALMIAAPGIAASPASPGPTADLAIQKMDRFESAWPVQTKARPRTLSKTVDCDDGETITRALRSRADEIEIFFVGTCTENVAIGRDFVTLRGLEGAVVLGSISISSSVGVTLRDFTVRDNPGFGIAVTGGSVARLEGITTTANGAQGLLVLNSAVATVDLIARENGRDGIVVARGSELNFTGLLDVDANARAGLFVTDNSDLSAAFFDLQASDTGFSGLVVQSVSNGVLALGEITANNNVGFSGLLFQNVSNVVLAAVTVTANGNLVAGLAMTSQGVLTEADSSFTFNGNGSGVLLTDNSSWVATLGSETMKEISGNTSYGVLAESNSTFSLLGASESDAMVLDNGLAGVALDGAAGRFDRVTAAGNGGPDLLVRFGSRADLSADNDFPTVSCEVGSLIHDDGELIVCDDDLSAGLAVTRRPQASPQPATLPLLF